MMIAGIVFVVLMTTVIPAFYFAYKEMNDE